jgi:hypothetical protein
MTVKELVNRMDADEFFMWIEYITEPQRQMQEKKQRENIESIKGMIRRAVPDADT